jgi:hypothetical protein
MRCFLLRMGVLSALLCSTVSAQTPLETTSLNILWRLVPGGHYMTSNSPNERNALPSNGAIFYVPSNNIFGTAPLYRLYLSPIGDHMDSLYPGEGGYYTEGILGYPYTTPDALPGLHQFIRVDDGTYPYHATRSDTDSIPGYGNASGLSAWGFARPNTATLSLLSLSAGGVTIESNGVAGGALWTWTWNGTQFINTDDCGREIQSSVFYPTSSGTQNPTEAGDQFTSSNLLGEQRHYSIVTALSNSGSTQTSQSIPLDFNPQSFGGSQDHPAMYPGLRIGKQITLNYHNLGAVAQYVTTFHTPVNLQNAQIEIPTGYLQKNFNRYFTYDAYSQSLTEVTGSLSSCSTDHNYGFTPASGYGGVIISDASGNNAMGVYGITTPMGGSVSYFALWNITCQNTSKWNAVFGPGTIPAGDNVYASWIMTGTLAYVQTLMNALYSGQ